MAKLYFKYGAMNCGKSTSVLQTAYNYEERGMTVCLIKPKTDTKGGGIIISRLGIAREVDLLVNATDNLYTILADRHPDCVIVDEVQFLSKKQIEELYEIASLEDIPVICYGLRTDFLNKGFEGSSRLLELAHSIQEIKNICQCGSKATCNIRLVDEKPVFEGEQTFIDGSNQKITYISVCSKCYLKAKSNANN